MVFTERQKAELKNIAKEISKDIVKELIYDQEFIDVLVDKLAKKVSDKISDTVEKLSTKTIQLEKKMDDIKGEQDDMRIKIEELEQLTKAGQLRIYGIPEGNDDNQLKYQLIDIFDSKLGVKNVELSQCYRIGTPKSKSRGNRAVLAVFDSIQQRNMVYMNKKKLKGSKIGIAEELVKSRYELVQYAREKLGKNMVWTVGGRICTKVNGKKVWLKNEEDVSKISQ